MLFFENEALKRSFGPKAQAGESYIMRSFIIITLQKIL
jgi:hypothetical protein